jgi:hypothetical protein
MEERPQNEEDPHKMDEINQHERRGKNPIEVQDA